MCIHFRLGRFNIYPWLFLAFTLVINMAVYLFFPQTKAMELYLPVTGAVAGFVYFLYSYHHQKTLLFINIFEKFNARYADLNEKLNSIFMRNAEDLTAAETDVLFDYFNLCAEEYLFYKSGYIDQDVWLSWISGMKHFAQNGAVHSLWASELKGGSYYGFSLAFFDVAHEPAQKYAIANCFRCGS